MVAPGLNTFGGAPGVGGCIWFNIGLNSVGCVVDGLVFDVIFGVMDIFGLNVIGRLP